MSHPQSLRTSSLVRASVLALSLIAAALLAPTEGPHVASVSGDVELATGVPPVFRPVGAGEPIGPGDVIRTGTDGRAELDLGRATVRLYPNSLLRIPVTGASTGGTEAVELDRGRSLFDVLKRPEDPFEVRTPEAVVSVKGTRFSVSLDDTAAAVAVFRGLVGVTSLRGADAFETLVRDGFVAVGRDRFELSLHQMGDPWESWSRGDLPELPSPEQLRLPDSAKERVLEARAAAIRTARPEAVEAAAKRHPEVAATLVRARTRESGGGLERGADLEARTDTGRQAVHRDAVLDRRHEKLEQRLNESFVEHYINEGFPPGTDPDGSTGLGISFIDGSGGSGSDRVLVYVSSAFNWEFQENYLRRVLDGSVGLPPSLGSLLAGNGVSEQQFAQGALMLFQ